MKNLAFKFKLKTQRYVDLKKKIEKVLPKRKQWKKELLELRKMVLSGNVGNGLTLGEAQVKIYIIQSVLDKTARSSTVKHRRRCTLTGRSRSPRSAVCRGYFRSHAAFGDIVGVKKC